MPWRVVVGKEMERWPDSFLLDPASESWIEAPDGIIPGYQHRTYSTDYEADLLARRIRAYGYVTATEYIEDDATG